MNLLFYGKDVNDCLRQASKELNISIENINYKVLKTSGFFNRTTEIKVTLNNFNTISKEIPTSNMTNVDSKSDVNIDFECGIKVENEKIILISSPNNNQKFTIKSCDGINLKINDVLCNPNIPYPVYENDVLIYTPSIMDSHRKMDVRISEDKMSAFAVIEYIPEYTYILNDTPISKNLILNASKKTGAYPKKYTPNDLKEALSNLKIKNGILENVFHQVCEGTLGKEILVASGTPKEDDTEDEIKILFNQEKNKFDINSNEKIDFRNLNNLSSVKKGDTLAIKIPGILGKNGSDIFGSLIPKKTLRSKPFKAIKGCTLSENKIIALISGRPSEQNGSFIVNEIYAVNDVDLNTGNINFLGDIEVNNSINDGMTVHSKGRILVRKNVTFATVSANGPISIMGSVINSNILAGGYDVERKIYLENLNRFHYDLTELINAIELLLYKSPERNIGELINILIDKRFNNITKLCMNILSFNISAGIQKSEILDFIRNKMMRLNTFNIKSIDELKYFKKSVQDEIETTNNSLEIPIDITLCYCQNSNIISTGSIYITGKGQYTSKIKAFNTIEFTQEKAVARGGTLNARKYIKLKKVGSEAGVITTLQVEPDGIITADIAYHNTVFCFGNRKKFLENSGKNIKAFMNKDNEIIIEKFVL